MKTESFVPTIILACGLIDLLLGIILFIDSPLMGLGWTGEIATTLSFVIVVFLKVSSKNKGSIFDERLGTRFYRILGMVYGITNIGIALTINSVFYDAGSVSNES